MFPIIKDVVDKYNDKIVYEVENPIVITSRNNILLTDFDDYELRLPDLTKAIYILFYKNPEGIDINKLNNYHTELLDLYMNISPRANLDQTQKSIGDLVCVENKLIHSHISRIKTQLKHILGESIAQFYIIKSEKHGSSFKYIPILKNNSKK